MLAVLIAIATILAIGGIWYYQTQQRPNTPNISPQNASTSSTQLNNSADLNSSSTITIQTKTVGSSSYALTETCDDLEQGICYNEVVRLVKSSTSSPHIILFSTSTPAYPAPSFDISPRDDFATINFKYAGSVIIDSALTQDSLIIVGTQKNFLKSFSDIELTTPKILNEAKGRRGYGLMLGAADIPDGCVDHPITWLPDESSVSGEICLWNFDVNPTPEIIDSNLFEINTADWSVQFGPGASNGSTSASSSATSTYKTGYIKSASKTQNQYYITIQAADFINDTNAPDGYRIVNHPDKVQSFSVYPTAQITLIGDTLAILQGDIILPTSSVPSLTLPFGTFESAFENGGYSWANASQFELDQLFNFSFQGGAIVNISEQYTPSI